jgi:hypothetical protein
LMNNVTQICLDNASTMLGALDDLVAMYPICTSKVVVLTFSTFSEKIGEKRKYSRP